VVTLHSRQQGKLPRHIYFLAAALIDQQLQVRSLASSPSGSLDLMGGASNAAVGIGECLGTLLRLLPVVVTDYATDEVGGRLRCAFMFALLPLLPRASKAAALPFDWRRHYRKLGTFC
jgi:hypothetical protein